jgi:hypothetical protein
LGNHRCSDHNANIARRIGQMAIACIDKIFVRLLVANSPRFSARSVAAIVSIAYIGKVG